MDPPDRSNRAYSDRDLAEALGDLRVSLVRIEAQLAAIAAVQSESRAAHVDLSERLATLEVQAARGRAWLAGAAAATIAMSGLVSWVASLAL